MGTKETTDAQSEYVQVNVTMKRELLARVDAAAERNYASRSGEVARRVAQSFDAEAAK